MHAVSFDTTFDESEAVTFFALFCLHVFTVKVILVVGEMRQVARATVARLFLPFS